MTPTPAFWLGLWGAVVSTALGGLRIFEFVRDRASLHLEPIWVRGDAGTDGHVEYSWTAAEPALRATNRGRRTIHVVGVGVRRAGAPVDLSGFLPRLPTVLDEGESVTLSLEKGLLDHKVKQVILRDSLGHEWRTGWRALRTFRKTRPPTED